MTSRDRSDSESQPRSHWPAPSRLKAATNDPRRSQPRRPSPAGQPPDDFVAALYRAHAVTLIRIALMLLGDQPSAEDVVQDAFLGLQRGLPRLREPAKALPYLRTSVVNGCRTVQRSRSRLRRRPVEHQPPVWSAEAAAIASEDRRAVLAAVASLPERAREVLASPLLPGPARQRDRRGPRASAGPPCHLPHPAPSSRWRASSRSASEQHRRPAAGRLPRRGRDRQPRYRSVSSISAPRRSRRSAPGLIPAAPAAYGPARGGIRCRAGRGRHRGRHPGGAGPGPDRAARWLQPGWPVRGAARFGQPG